MLAMAGRPSAGCIPVGGHHDDEVDGPRAASMCQDEAVEFII
jgi:hypothetical protein